MGDREEEFDLPLEVLQQAGFEYLIHLNETTDEKLRPISVCRNFDQLEGYKISNGFVLPQLIWVQRYIMADSCACCKNSQLYHRTGVKQSRVYCLYGLIGRHLNCSRPNN